MGEKSSPRPKPLIIITQQSAPAGEGEQRTPDGRRCFSLFGTQPTAHLADAVGREVRFVFWPLLPLRCPCHPLLSVAKTKLTQKKFVAAKTTARSFSGFDRISRSARRAAGGREVTPPQWHWKAPLVERSTRVSFVVRGAVSSFLLFSTCHANASSLFPRPLLPPRDSRLSSLGIMAAAAQHLAGARRPSSQVGSSRR